jgi:pyruvate formate lyase activating enzyme
MTALDYPGGLISAVIFAQGCNFACPYCHNPNLVRLFGEPVDDEGVMAFLRRRRGLLDGVVISGGEPTLQPDLADFCKKLRGLGYLVKIDTNGARPEVVADLIERKLINYVALDLKADPRAYPAEIAPADPGGAVLETVGLLKRSGLPHEFRTTVVRPFVTEETIIAIARAAAGTAPLYLQKYRPGPALNPARLAAAQPGPADLERLRDLASVFTTCLLRGA